MINEKPNRKVNEQMRGTRGLILKAPPAHQTEDRKTINAWMRREISRGKSVVERDAQQ